MALSGVSGQSLAQQFENFSQEFEHFSQEAKDRFDTIEKRLGGLEKRITRLKASDDNTASTADVVATRSLAGIEEDKLNGRVRAQLDNFMDHIRVADHSRALIGLLGVIDSVGTDQGHHPLSERNLEKLQECHQAFMEGMNSQSPDQNEQALIDEMIMKGMNYMSFAESVWGEVYYAADKADDAQKALVTMATLLEPWIVKPKAATGPTLREHLLSGIKEDAEPIRLMLSTVGYMSHVSAIAAAEAAADAEGSGSSSYKSE